MYFVSLVGKGVALSSHRHVVEWWEEKFCDVQVKCRPKSRPEDAPPGQGQAQATMVTLCCSGPATACTDLGRIGGNRGIVANFSLLGVSLCLSADRASACAPESHHESISVHPMPRPFVSCRMYSTVYRACSYFFVLRQGRSRGFLGKN